jgi:hypothetical protein
MLNDFVYGKLKCKGAKKIVPNIANLVNVAHKKIYPYSIVSINTFLVIFMNLSYGDIML